jgi:hypothetical protein
MRVLFPFLASLCAASVAMAQLPTFDPPRGWKTTEGAAFQASVLSYDGTNVDFQKKTLEILLNGRSEADLMKQIRTGYSHLGIRL